MPLFFFFDLYLGYGVKRTPEIKQRAIKLLEEAKTFHWRAAQNLAKVYQYGDGVAKNTKNAIENYKLAISLVSPKHPDVPAMQNEISKLESELVSTNNEYVMNEYSINKYQ